MWWFRSRNDSWSIVQKRLLLIMTASWAFYLGMLSGKDLVKSSWSTVFEVALALLAIALIATNHIAKRQKQRVQQAQQADRETERKHDEEHRRIREKIEGLRLGDCRLVVAEPETSPDSPYTYLYAVVHRYAFTAGRPGKDPAPIESAHLTFALGDSYARSVKYHFRDGEEWSWSRDEDEGPNPQEEQTLCMMVWVMGKVIREHWPAFAAAENGHRRSFWEKSSPDS